MSRWLSKSKNFKTLTFELKLLGYNLVASKLIYHFIESRGKLSFSFVGYDLPIIPKSLFLFKKLRSIELQSNKIDQIFEDIGFLNRLNKLNLSNNIISNLPYSFEKLKYMEELMLSFNKLELINIDFLNYPYLSVFYANNNNLSTFPKNLMNCPELIELDLSHNKIISLPDRCQSLNLRILKLNDNEINEIPEYIGTLPKLVIIDIKNNNISKIPDTLLNNIDRFLNINAAGNNMHDILTSVNDSVFERILLKNSNNMDEVHQKNGDIFKFITERQLLKIYLELRLNQINLSLLEISRIFTINGKNLEINLVNLQVDYFLISITYIDNVTSLRMPLSLLNTLPKDLNKLRSLKILRCWNSDNNNTFVMSELPSSIVRFNELEILDMWFNKTRRIPDIIGNLKNLRSLILAYNDLTYIPDLTDLDNLKVLDLRGMDIKIVHLSPKTNVRVLR